MINGMDNTEDIERGRAFLERLRERYGDKYWILAGDALRLVFEGNKRPDELHVEYLAALGRVLREEA